jgi:hypothetical protein
MRFPRPVLLLILFGACASPAIDGAFPAQVAPVTEPGFQLFPTPRSGDGPGTVFRITPEGVRYDVVDLSGALSPAVTVETYPLLIDSTARSLRGDVLLKFVAAGGRITTQLDRDVRVEFMLGGARREKTTDVEIDRVLRPRLADIIWRPNDRYYVIRETILVDSMRLKIDRSSANQLDQDATFRTVAADTMRLRWSRDATYQLAQRFVPPQRVMYKVDRIEPAADGFGGGTVTTVTYRPVTDRLEFTEGP